MMRGALHRLKTLPFRRSTRFSHFRSNPQIFDTGFSRLFPSYFSPSHHSPRSFPGHPDRAPRSARFSALYAQLEKPVKEAVPAQLHSRGKKEKNAVIVLVHSRAILPSYLINIYRSNRKGKNK